MNRENELWQNGNGYWRSFAADGKQEEEILSYASACGNDGADGLVFVDGSRTDEEHEYNIGLIRKMARAIDIPIFAGGR